MIRHFLFPVFWTGTYLSTSFIKLARSLSKCSLLLCCGVGSSKEWGIEVFSGLEDRLRLPITEVESGDAESGCEAVPFMVAIALEGRRISPKFLRMTGTF